MGLINKLREIAGKHSDRLLVRIICFSLTLSRFLQTPENGSFRDISVVYWADKNKNERENRKIISYYLLVIILHSRI